jgi:hypothetical protein
MLKRILSPTRARIAGPGTWSPKVQALNFTPGAISMILCVVSSCTTFTGAGSSGLSSAVRLSESPLAKAPLCRSLVSLAGVGFRSIFAGSYLSTGAAGLQAARASVATQQARTRIRKVMGGRGD